MKPLLLPVCFAAVAAAAAQLKDPADVARDWNRVVEETRQPLSLPEGLDQQFRRPSKPATFTFEPLPPTSLPPETKRYDAPGPRPPEKLQHDRPPGAVPWEYKGYRYWLVPLGTPVQP